MISDYSMLNVIICLACNHLLGWPEYKVRVHGQTFSVSFVVWVLMNILDFILTLVVCITLNLFNIFVNLLLVHLIHTLSLLFYLLCGKVNNIERRGLISVKFLNPSNLMESA